MAFGMNKMVEELNAKFDLLIKKLDEILVAIKDKPGVKL